MRSPPTRQLITALVMLVATSAPGCGLLGEARPAVPTNPHCHVPGGSVAQWKTAPGAIDLYGFSLQLSAAADCGRGQAVELIGAGHRTLEHRNVLRRGLCAARNNPHDGCQDLCVGRPLPDEPCKRVSAMAIAMEARQRLTDAGRLASVGYSGCGERSGEPGFWYVTLDVYDWADLDPAIAALADRMRAWRVGDRLRIAVKPMNCGVAL